LFVDGDAMRLGQVFSNLLANAAKYTEPGGRIELSAAREGGEAVVRVKDTGVGIPAEMLPTVFDMFAQVGTSLERSQGGLGIGLTLVRRLVEMHGGTVGVESEGVNKGSTFTVRLPLAAGDAAEGGGETARASEPASVPEAPIKVLVVDDNKDGAASLALLLKLSGHVSRTAHTGPEGLTAAAEFRPDVIFLDIGMPGMSGFEVARTLREDAAFEDTTLVALTGWGSEEDRKRSKDAGFDEHVTKPIDADDVKRILARL
jgi:CheY-like chemotaxis protein/anti-sigma regulatory factor (Ser/Thr protein kinase)